MVMPDGLTVERVGEMVEEDTKVMVINVYTHMDTSWKLSRRVKYYKTHPQERDGIYNVLYFMQLPCLTVVPSKSPTQRLVIWSSAYNSSRT
jgi:hypothetical protein